LARWLARLSGERADLEEFPRWFPDGDVYAMEGKAEFFLTGPAFEAISNAEAVLAEAKRRLDEFAAVISLLWPALRKPIVDTIIREDGGTRHISLFLSASLSSRAKVTAVISGGVAQQGPRRTQAQELLEHATGRPHLREALSVWGDPMRSWPRLYRILEEIELDLGNRVDQAGLCSAHERATFRRSAEVPEAAGLDARHASRRFEPPRDPMTFQEATAFIGQILLRVLR